MSHSRAGRKKPDAMTQLQDVLMTALRDISDNVITEHNLAMSKLPFSDRRTFASLAERRKLEKSDNGYWGLSPTMIMDACRTTIQTMWGP